jgi:microcystin-dependent protein
MPDSTWLLCQGQALDKDVYDELFLVIGYTYTDGSHGATFNLPDMQARFPVGRDYNGAAQPWCNELGETHGPEDGEITLDKNAIPELDTSIASVTDENPMPQECGEIVVRDEVQDGYQVGDNQPYDSQTVNGDPWVKAGNPNPDPISILPPSITLNFIIKVSTS